MVNLNIQLTEQETGIFGHDRKIVEIDIKNGAWKYWDYHKEDDEKTSLTINNVSKAHYLHYPVKDAYPFYDNDELRNNNKIVVTDAMVRTYDTLLSYLNCRINNMKEENKKYGWTEMTKYITLFDDSIVRNSDDVTADVIYEKSCLVKVEIKVVE